MFAVIFEVMPRPERWDAYLGYAASLRPELLAIEGFIANERFASKTRPGWLVSLSLWRDEKALIRWRTHALHHDIQGKGRSAIFADYHLRVGEVTTDTQAAEPLPQQRFDETDAGAKAVTLTEPQTTADTAAPDGGKDQVEADSFESITRPGQYLHLRSWRSLQAAQAMIQGSPGQHRVVRIIRDYSMHARAEAPQYFPPI